MRDDWSSIRFLGVAFLQTQAGGVRLAELLLRLYAIAIVPLTFWVVVFTLQLPAPLEAL